MRKKQLIYQFCSGCRHWTDTVFHQIVPSHVIFLLRCLLAFFLWQVCFFVALRVTSLNAVHRFLFLLTILHTRRRKIRCNGKSEWVKKWNSGKNPNDTTCIQMKVANSIAAHAYYTENVIMYFSLAIYALFSLIYDLPLFPQISWISNNYLRN